MNYPNIYFVLYLFSGITFLFAALGLGKYFCVKVLYDWYDDLDEFTERLLAVYIVGALVLIAADFISLYFQLEWLTLVSSVLIIISLLVLCIFFVIFGVIGICCKAAEFHKFIKHKKNMR